MGARSSIVLRPLSSRTRVVLAAVMAALPLAALIAYSAVDRYQTDRDRATARAAARAEIYASLLSEGEGRHVSQAELDRLGRVLAVTDESSIAVFAFDGSEVARAGDSAGRLATDDPRLLEAVKNPGQTFDDRGPDGVGRIWGFAEVSGRPLVVGYALPGASIYGPARDALWRDLALAVLATTMALVTTFVLAGRATAPIRRLAARVGGSAGPADDLGALERGLDEMGERIEESQAELQRRAERLEHVLDERNRVNEELQHLNEQLEDRVATRTAQVEAANRELEAFSYSVSHDLRAPLRAIDGFSRILVDDHANELSVDGLRYLALVRRNAQEMGELIDGLLAFAHLGHQPLEKRLVDVEVLAQDLVEGLKAERNGHSLELEVGSLPPALADARLLRQVYANLLSNALKYSGSSDPARIELGAVEARKPAVYFVRDNGVGFDMRYSEKLFQVFQRLHSDGYEGTGLGLALAARIVQRHGGAIWAEGTPGRGATFYFTLEGEPA